MKIFNDRMSPTRTLVEPGRDLIATRVGNPSNSGAVQLSATGQLLLTARQALRAVPEIREHTVRELGGQLTTGRYRPNPEAIATAMVTD